MNKNRVCDIFLALANEGNLNLFLQIVDGEKTTKALKSKLSPMPLNRRLNILKNSGLITREVTVEKKNEFINSMTPLGEKIYNLMTSMQKMEIEKVLKLQEKVFKLELQKQKKTLQVKEERTKLYNISLKLNRARNEMRNVTGKNKVNYAEYDYMFNRNPNTGRL